MAEVNNAFYDDLGERWYEGDDHAIALLRVESYLKLGYTFEVLRTHRIEAGSRVLDVACGAGLVTLPMATAGYRMEGVDLAENALDVARQRVPEGADATFRLGD
ncbi:MAG: methyltransferase domain-containing protein, partial [Bacteroidota bacterium]